MTPDTYIFTSESVSEGHPDKVCDQLSDAIVDTYLAKDPNARTAIECLVTLNRVVLAGEVNSKALISRADRAVRVREVLKDIGYQDPGFHYETVEIADYIHEQSPDIAQGVDQASGDLGAGDQGMMMGYACHETPALMPAPIYYAHLLLRLIQEDRRKGLLPGIKPDAKTQLSMRYENGVPKGLDVLVISIQHAEHLDANDIREILDPYVRKAIPADWMCAPDHYYVNPTGRFVVGGPAADTGLTGRKIIVDTYGAAAPHGGGAFSGKDPSKVDRSGAYMARYLAKNIVAAGLATHCTVQLAYCIGRKDPVSFYINTHQTASVSSKAIEHFLRKAVDLTPQGIIQRFDLCRPIYLKTASYGHFGRDHEQGGSFTWEKTDLAEALAKEFLTTPMLMMS